MSKGKKAFFRKRIRGGKGGFGKADYAKTDFCKGGSARAVAVSPSGSPKASVEKKTLAPVFSSPADVAGISQTYLTPPGGELRRERDVRFASDGVRQNGT
ncbi:hypothetical protein GHK58_10705 [Sinorhizobium meliloti]|nr:hypothetical protein [Sinorhizobium meliloti]